MKSVSVKWILILGLFYNKQIAARSPIQHKTEDNYLIKENAPYPPLQSEPHEITNPFEQDLEDIFNLYSSSDGDHNLYEDSNGYEPTAISPQLPYYDRPTYFHSDLEPNPPGELLKTPNDFNDPEPNMYEEVGEIERNNEEDQGRPPPLFQQSHSEEFNPTFYDTPYMMAIPVQLHYFINSQYKSPADTEKDLQRNKENLERNVVEHKSRGGRFRRALSRTLLLKSKTDSNAGIRSDLSKGSGGNLILKDHANCGRRRPGQDGNNGNNGGNGIDPRGSGGNDGGAAASAGGDAADAAAGETEALRVSNRRTSNRQRNRSRGLSQ